MHVKLQKLHWLALGDRDVLIGIQVRESIYISLHKG